MDRQWENDEEVSASRKQLRFQIFNAVVATARTHVKQSSTDIESLQLPYFLSDTLVPILDKISDAAGCTRQRRRFKEDEKMKSKDFDTLISMFANSSPGKSSPGGGKVTCTCCQVTATPTPPFLVFQLSRRIADIVLCPSCQRLTFSLVQSFSLSSKFKSAKEHAASLQAQMNAT